MNPGGDVGQDLVGVLVGLGEGLHVELTHSGVGKHVAVAHRLGVVVGVRNVLAQEVSDVASNRPVIGLGGVGQEDLHVAAANPDDDVELVVDRDHADGSCVARETAQLGDELVEIVGEHRLHGDRGPLAIIVVESYDEVDLVLACVLEIIVVIVIVIIVVVVVLVIGQLVVLIEIVVVIDVIVGNKLVIAEPGHDDLLGGERLHRCRHLAAETVAGPI